MAQTITKRGPVSGTAVARASRKRKPFLLDLYGTAVGKKYVMAITGLGLIGFVVFHMIGNLKMYMGASDLNHYAHFLEKLLYPILPEKAMLWILRGGLITMLLLHLHAAYTLTVLNRRARPVKYQSERDYQVASFASRSMRLTGIVVLLFVIWHLLDLTFGAGSINSFTGSKDAEGLKDVYGAVVFSLDRVPVAIFYVLANIMLGTHLFHGVWSLFQSLGWNNPKFNKWRTGAATGIATLVVVGNVSFPIAVLAGIVG
ncbi:MAG: succinate dehydrogenase cytochrome b subunit [Ilumatobacteraceae bacterium]|jgi:succinate dehydrogenase / fumarate reductase cytochrome b subunit|nr:succinate dehydrogenase cytochrome b subunit [Ilumatobacteraceae bacterium]